MELRRLTAVLRPFDFTSDVSNLLTCVLPGSRSWLFEEFAEWLKLGPKDPNYRAMVLYGGPGLGKSTVAAALVKKEAIGSGGHGSAVAGHYFCKYDDRK